MIGIRRAEPGDAQALVELASEVSSEEGAWLLTTAAWRSVADERRYLRAVRRHPDAAVYVARMERPRRQALARPRSPSRERPRRRPRPDGRGEPPAARRREALLEQAVEWAEGAGVRKLELHVFPWNEPAIALYTSFGFEREGLRKGHYLRGGAPVDAILMALQIPAP